MPDEMINAGQTRRVCVEPCALVRIAFRQSSENAFDILHLISLEETINNRLIQSTFIRIGDFKDGSEQMHQPGIVLYLQTILVEASNGVNGTANHGQARWGIRVEKCYQKNRWRPSGDIPYSGVVRL